LVVDEVSVHSLCCSCPLSSRASSIRGSLGRQLVTVPTSLSSQPLAPCVKLAGLGSGTSA
jgi:hypothetical protein